MRALLFLSSDKSLFQTATLLLSPVTEALPEEQSVPRKDKNAGSVFEQRTALARLRAHLRDEVRNRAGRAVMDDEQRLCDRGAPLWPRTDAAATPVLKYLTLCSSAPKTAAEPTSYLQTQRVAQHLALQRARTLRGHQPQIACEFQRRQPIAKGEIEQIHPALHQQIIATTL